MFVNFFLIVAFSFFVMIIGTDFGKLGVWFSNVFYKLKQYAIIAFFLGLLGVWLYDTSPYILAIAVVVYCLDRSGDKKTYVDETWDPNPKV